MDDPSQEKITSIVRHVFDVSEFTKTEFALEFRIADWDFKSKFEDLARRLEGMSYVCRLERVDGGIYVIVQKVHTWKAGMAVQVIVGSQDSVCSSGYLCDGGRIL